MPYKTWATNDPVSAADLNAMTADASQADVATSEATASTSYTDLATVGPAVTVTLVAGQGCLVAVSCRHANSVGGSGNAGFMSFAVSGAETDAAVDADAIVSLATTSTEQTTTRMAWYVAGTTGSHTFTAKYKASNNTSTFRERRIVVKKF